MDRHTTAQRLADRLFAFEQALDLALALGGESVADLARARQELGLGIKVGASAITKLAASCEELAGVREQVADVHDSLSALQRKLGLQTVAIGGGDKGPNDEALPVSSLRRAA